MISFTGNFDRNTWILYVIRKQWRIMLIQEHASFTLCSRFDYFSRVRLEFSNDHFTFRTCAGDSARILHSVDVVFQKLRGHFRHHCCSVRA